MIIQAVLRVAQGDVEDDAVAARPTVKEMVEVDIKGEEYQFQF